MQRSPACIPIRIAVVLDDATAKRGLRLVSHFAFLNDLTAKIIDQITTTLKIAKFATVPK